MSSKQIDQLQKMSVLQLGESGLDYVGRVSVEERSPCRRDDAAVV